MPGVSTSRTTRIGTRVPGLSLPRTRAVPPTTKTAPDTGQCEEARHRSDRNPRLGPAPPQRPWRPRRPHSTPGLVGWPCAVPRNTLNSTSLGRVPNAETKRARGSFRASTSAPDEVWPTTRALLSPVMGSTQLTMTLPDRSPACSVEHVVDLVPVHREQGCLGAARGLGWRTGAGRPLRLTGKPLQFLLAARMVEDHFMPGSRKQRPELAPINPEPRMPMSMVPPTCVHLLHGAGRRNPASAGARAASPAAELEPGSIRRRSSDYRGPIHQVDQSPQAPF